jgi:hypothetical protein
LGIVIVGFDVTDQLGKNLGHNETKLIDFKKPDSVRRDVYTIFS